MIDLRNMFGCSVTWISRLRRDRRGTAMLEMTILAPVLLVIGLGVLEFGNLIFKRHMIENGIRDAARYIAGIQGCDFASEKPTSDAEDWAINIATYGKLTNTGPERVPGWALPAADIHCEVIPATYGGQILRGSGIGGATNTLMLVKIDTDVTYGTLSLGFLGVLDNLGSTGFNTLSFPVKHEERYYGTR